MKTETMNPADTLAALGVTVESVFVPFSQSRNKDQDHRTLNWRVTIKRNGREVLTTDYSAGIAHCPSYGRAVPSGFHGSKSLFQRIVTRAECETGHPVQRVLNNDSCLHGKSRILPDPMDVLYSLVMDSSVLDAGGFEEWAADFGYDTDSRQAESIYRDCLDIALKMRAAFGDDGFRALQDAFQDY